jgi:hypothetical protein
MLRNDLVTIGILVGLDVVARLLPHAPDFTPVAATALFAASVLRVRALAVVVPIAAMTLGDAMLGFYDWRVMMAVYTALALPTIAACLSSRLRRPLMIVPVLLASSLTFFVVANFAVWAFTSIYVADTAGLIKCYIAALPFLRNMIAGDLCWGLMLFGTYWLVRTIASAKAAKPTADAVAA